LNLAEFDYELPEELIAQEPLEDRAASRMLVVFRNEARWEDHAFREFPQFLREGDCLVLNDSRVFPARLWGRRPEGGGTEVLLLQPVSSDGRDWQALVRPGRKMRTGTRVRFMGGLECEVIARGELGERTVRFSGVDDVWAAFEHAGHVPLPPYIKRPDRPADRDRYQTVFARQRGSTAAPTAGLHFTDAVLEECRRRAEITFVTLHVGLGTFQPLHTEHVEDGRLHSERYSIAASEAARIREANRVVAVGTTSVRTIESAWRTGELSGETEMFIYPGYQFQRVGALLTNFHLPRTSLLLLVCALAGKELTLAAYRHAVEAQYRFYSYGDCMLVVP
jgi:S-adenosylmethionine:tRNA ribosyltransferase-isomerase